MTGSPRGASQKEKQVILKDLSGLPVFKAKKTELNQAEFSLNQLSVRSRLNFSKITTTHDSLEYCVKLVL
jgi:hypothetical protein